MLKTCASTCAPGESAARRAPVRRALLPTACALALALVLAGAPSAGAATASPTAQVVIRQGDVPGFEAGGLGGELLSESYRPCFAANALLAKSPTPAVATVPVSAGEVTSGASFTQGSLLSGAGVERVVSSIAWQGASAAQAQAAFATLTGSGFTACVEAALRREAGLAEVPTVAASDLLVPAGPAAAETGGVLVMLSIFDTASGTVGKTILYGITAVRVGRLLALLETDTATLAAPAAVPFPEAERVHLIELLETRMARAAGTPLASPSAPAPTLLPHCLCEKPHGPDRGGQAIRFAILGKSVCPSDFIEGGRVTTEPITKLIVEGRNQEGHPARWTTTAKPGAVEVLVGNGHWWWIGNVTIRYWLGSRPYVTHAWVPRWRSAAFDLGRGLIVEVTCGGTLKLGHSVGALIPADVSSRLECFAADGTVAGLEVHVSYEGLFLVGWNEQPLDVEALGANGEVFTVPNIILQHGQYIDCEPQGSTNTDTS